MRKPKWTMKDGTKILVRDMTTQHLANAIAYLKRWSRLEHERVLHDFPFGLSFTGEMAEYYFEQECDRLFQSQDEDYLPDIYYDLVDEYRKRGMR